MFAFYASSAPDLDENLLKDPLSSEFLDINGNVIHKSGAEKREFVPYAEIPEHDARCNSCNGRRSILFPPRNGFLATWWCSHCELQRWFRFARCKYPDQQVIKNSFLSDEKTLKRKAQEAWLAFQLERKYEKEEIFEMYFNKILMSGNNYGFGTAAELFLW